MDCKVSLTLDFLPHKHYCLLGSKASLAPMLYNSSEMKQRIAFVFAVSVVVGLVGAGISFVLPNQYTAKGLLIITRKADESSKEFFTYEGSYAQQNAAAYTATFLSILQSPNNLMSADSSLGVNKLSRLVKAKKEGAQTVSLSVKGNTPKQALELWNKISESAMQTHNQLKAGADPLINVDKTPNSPVVLKTYPEGQKVFGVGFLFSVVILSSVIVVIRYLREEHDY